jgi:hypothetical protein
MKVWSKSGYSQQGGRAGSPHILQVPPAVGKVPDHGLGLGSGATGGLRWTTPGGSVPVSSLAAAPHAPAHSCGCFPCAAQQPGARPCPHLGCNGVQRLVHILGHVLRVAAHI